MSVTKSVTGKRDRVEIYGRKILPKAHRKPMRCLPHVHREPTVCFLKIDWLNLPISPISATKAHQSSTWAEIGRWWEIKLLPTSACGSYSTHAGS